ncbi:hypothetical protein BofuT4_uP105480.1 [Botrytis cinerea T4]|uniref:Uncharacterized protein n=1 Tax=Botryotinia fuckeliana (strain T4) TaxID=999810 RepID=G2Y8I3_BOTF4|nr:hypothetical protein BofuT4_uP105480.1 [Botrytis cinerea T4]
MLRLSSEAEMCCAEMTGREDRPEYDARSLPEGRCKCRSRLKIDVAKVCRKVNPDDCQMMLDEGLKSA